MAAFLTLVAIGSLVVAVGTFARDVAVGQELSRLLVVELPRRFLHQFSLVVEFAEEVGRKLVMRLRCGARIDIEGDTKVFKRGLDHLVIAVDNILRCDALFPGPDGDGHSVFVAAADEHHGLLLKSQVAHINIGRYIDTSQVAYVHTAVGIWQGCRHRRPLECRDALWRVGLNISFFHG